MRYEPRVVNKTDRICLITGANDGIGLETAKQLAALGWRVLVHARSEAKAAKAASAVGKSAEPVWADLADLEQVVAMAGQVAKLIASLDVLVNNAGVYESERSLTKDGFERTMGVNHFSHMLLTLKLQPLLAKAKQARVITVSSVAHQGGGLDLDDLNMERGWSAYGAYAASKLANVLFARELARRPGFGGMLSFSLHPGVIATKLLHKGFGPGGAPLAGGAKTSVYCATAPGLESQQGGYFSDSAPVAAHAQASNAHFCMEFFERSLKDLRPWL